MKKKVLIAMSGGVDSSLSALILLNQGYNVEGLTMIMFGNDIDNQSLIKKAQQSANKLNIKHHILDCRKQFYNSVINNFISEYNLGQTPNPCVVCNKYIKFGLFLHYAKNLDFDYIATGHYANKIYDTHSKEYLLKKSIDENKDQSYVLYNLNQDILKYVLFPIANYNKNRVKEMARNNKLISNNYNESQDICFIPNKNYVSFLEKITGQKSPPGNFVDENNNIYGPHKGFWNYTIGQRKGLNMSFSQRMFVSKLNYNDKSITISKNDPHRDYLIAHKVNIISPNYFYDNLQYDNLQVDAKIRYKHKQTPATLKIIKNNEILVTFDIPQRAITKGQSVVFYKDNIVIGGGIIK